MSPSDRVQSRGLIVDYMLSSDGTGYDVCINFDEARVKPVTLSSRLLTGVDIVLGSVIEAEINSGADEEYFVNPTSIKPLLNMEELYRWR